MKTDDEFDNAVRSILAPDYRTLYETEKRRADQLESEVKGLTYLLAKALRKGPLSIPKRIFLDDRPSIRHMGEKYAEAPGWEGDIIYRTDSQDGMRIVFTLGPRLDGRTTEE